MGNIRPSFIKIRAIALVEQHGEKFTEDFDHNKLMVQQLTDVDSKKLRNWIAGYVTRYRQRRTDRGRSMAHHIRVDWTQDPVSLHAETADVLTQLFAILREQHGLKKRSIPMPDHENGGFVAFLYAPIDPRVLAAAIEEVA